MSPSPTGANIAAGAPNVTCSYELGNGERRMEETPLVQSTYLSDISRETGFVMHGGVAKQQRRKRGARGRTWAIQEKRAISRGAVVGTQADSEHTNTRSGVAKVQATSYFATSHRHNQSVDKWGNKGGIQELAKHEKLSLSLSSELDVTRAGVDMLLSLAIIDGGGESTTWCLALSAQRYRSTSKSA
ncbi:hypothetical protein BDV93DRAFT_512033 [Ceratobasidium sp. AG-I]|nr:hypothetical protein BDV93DRAFT_512033 [Ceratobasidium sp. AG-I]